MPMPEHIERLLRTFPEGAHVVAALHIIYGAGPEVSEGTHGTVVADSSGGLVYVRWDGVGYPLGTSTDSIDPEPPS
jgi:hypothetical protein